MKVKTIFGPTAVLLLLVSAAAVGQMHPRMERWADPGFGLLGPGMLDRVGDEIGLDDSQKAQIDALLLDSRRKGIELRSQCELARLDLQVALDKDKPSESEVLKAAAKVNEAQGKLQAERLSTLVRVKQLLKPEQIEKLNQLRRDRWDRRMRSPGDRMMNRMPGGGMRFRSLPPQGPQGPGGPSD